MLFYNVFSLAFISLRQHQKFTHPPILFSKYQQVLNVIITAAKLVAVQRKLYGKQNKK